MLLRVVAHAAFFTGLMSADLKTAGICALIVVACVATFVAYDAYRRIFA